MDFRFYIALHLVIYLYMGFNCIIIQIVFYCCYIKTFSAGSYKLIQTALSIYLHIITVAHAVTLMVNVCCGWGRFTFLIAVSSKNH